MNFTKAGTELGYAQSNITGQIHVLEQELQVKLFERFGRGIRLTSEGQSFLQNARHILALCQKAKEEISPQIFHGVINIGAAETVCVYRLPQILMNYHQQYPSVDIHVRTESCDNMLQLLKENTIDVALVLTDKIHAADIVVETLHDETMILVASPLHALTRKNRIRPADLSGECLILTAAGCGYRPLVLSMLKQYKVKPTSLMELSSVGAIKECTACGLGIALLPKIAVREELAQGKLLELPWAGPAFDVKTKLIYHREKWLTPALQAFLTLCASLEK